MRAPFVLLIAAVTGIVGFLAGSEFGPGRGETVRSERTVAAAPDGDERAPARVELPAAKPATTEVRPVDVDSKDDAAKTVKGAEHLVVKDIAELLVDSLIDEGLPS